MKKVQPFANQQEMDQIHHHLSMQIAKISVEEEEERMKAEFHKHCTEADI